MLLIFYVVGLPLHIRLWRYPLKGASSLEVLNIRSPSKKRGRSTWLNGRADRTTSLRLARNNVSEPSISVMDIDGIMKAIKNLLLTYMQEPSNSRFLQNTFFEESINEEKQSITCHKLFWQICLSLLQNISLGF